MRLGILLCILFCFNKQLYSADNPSELIEQSKLKQLDKYLQQGLYNNAKDLLESTNKYFDQNELNSTQLYYLWSKYYYYLRENSEFEKFALKSYEASKSTEDNSIKVYGIYSKAFYLYSKRDYKASFQLLKEIENLIDLEDDSFLAMMVYYKYYGMYTQWENSEKTDFYTKKLIEIAQQEKDYHKLSDAYIARSFAMEYLYNETGSQVYKDSIKYFTEKAAYLDLKYPNEVGYPTQSIAYLNLANIYSEALANGDLSLELAKDSIIKYTDLAKNINTLFDYHFGIRGNVLNQRAKLYIKEGKIEAAEDYLLTAFEQLNSVDNDQKMFYALQNISGELYDFYTSIGEYQKANTFLEKYMTYKDSIFNQNKISEINELEAKYDLRRIKERNVHLETQNRWKTIQNYLLLTIFILLSLVFYFIWKNNRKKIALHKLKQKKILFQKEKAERETIQVKDKQDKLRKEALASNLQIKRKDELLNEIQEYLNSEQHHSRVQKSFKREEKINKIIAKSVEEFKDIPPEFFKKLKDHSSGKLTALDIKYCAYFYLGLETKEIARIFHVEGKSVRMTKYRIKQKLKLSKEQSLEFYLNSL